MSSHKFRTVFCFESTSMLHSTYNSPAPRPSTRQSATANINVRPSVSREAQHKFADKEEARKYLLAHGVDTASWGANGAKRVEDLLEEMQDKEISLQLIDGKMYRTVSLVKVVVRNPEVPRYHLVCYEQQLADGRKRPCNALLAVKKKPDETAQQAATRAIEKELGSVLPHVLPQELGSVLRMGTCLRLEKIEEPHLGSRRDVRSRDGRTARADSSTSYPTLCTRRELHQVEVHVRGLPIQPFVSELITDYVGDGTSKCKGWKWVRDSEEDLRHEGLGPRLRPSTAQAEGDQRKGFDVSFINSPMGSATYWPAATAYLSPRRWHRWQPAVSNGAGILTPMKWNGRQPPPIGSRAFTCDHVPPMSHVGLRSADLRRPANNDVVASMPIPACSPALEEVLAPPYSQHGGTPSPRGMRVPLRRVGVAKSVQEGKDEQVDLAAAAVGAPASTVPHALIRRLYTSPGLQDTSTEDDEGFISTRPFSARARARRLATRVHMMRVHAHASRGSLLKFSHGAT